MQIPLANIHWRFLLVRDDLGFQVNPLCRHDITSPFPPSGNEGYVRNRDVMYINRNLVSLGEKWQKRSLELTGVKIAFILALYQHKSSVCFFTVVHACLF